jgi:hypothetical protein
LIQMEGTDQQNGLNSQGLPTWSRPYLSNPTEVPVAGSTEVWEIYNLTMDTHPIHFHLVNVQLIQRAKFNVGDPGNPVAPIPPIFAPIAGTERAPNANEVGWKETIRMNPGEVTMVIMKFDLPKVPFTMPFNTRDAAFPAKSHEYVWHCHILEHEEHDMMRPLVVVGPAPLVVMPPSQTDAKKSVVTFTIFNGTPPYSITSDDKKFLPSPAVIGASGGSFNVTIKNGINPNNNMVTYTIKDAAGAIAAATLTITKK